MAKVAFLGLGVMGFPMAGHLKERGGHDVTVYNRSPAKAAAWVERFGGSLAATPRAAAFGADIVCACVGNDDDLRSVTIGPDGAFDGMPAGAIFADHTTASATVARELYAAAKARGLNFLDAPITGGQAGAEGGVLSVMVGGDADIYERAAPVLQAFSRQLTYMGPSGSGQLAKMCNQIVVAGNVQGLAEAIHFGMTVGLDMEKVIGAISKGAAQSWQMENRWKTMVEGKFEFGFAVDWMRKDLGIVLDEARGTGAKLPLTALVDQFYADVQTMGGRRWDTSALIARLNPTKH